MYSKLAQIDENFIKILNKGGLLTSSHIEYFTNLFASQHPNSRKMLVLSCHFFADFMPSTSKQIEALALQPSLAILARPSSSAQSGSYDLQRGLQEGGRKKIRILEIIDEQEPAKKPKVMSQGNMPNNPQPAANAVPQFHFKINNIKVIQEEGTYKWSKVADLVERVRQKYQIGPEQNVFDQFERIFIPINLRNDHWICAIIFVKQRIIQFLDSTQKFQEDVYNGIIELLNYNRANPSKQKWTLQTGMPEQKNNYDCGVFILKALSEALDKGKPITKTSWTQKDVTEFREYLYQIACHLKSKGI